MKKPCSQCGISKPLEDFYPRHDTKDGRTAACRDCTKSIEHKRYQADPIAAATRKRELRAKNPDAAPAAMRRFYERRPDYHRDWRREHPETIRESSRRFEAKRVRDPVKTREQRHKHYEANSDRIRADHRARHHADPQAARRRSKDWRLRNPAAAAALDRRHYEKRRAQEKDAFIEHIDRSIVWERDDGICGICHRAAESAKWQLDHIIPLSRGGLHCYANVRVSHRACNYWKNGRLDSELGELPARLLVESKHEG